MSMRDFVFYHTASPPSAVPPTNRKSPPIGKLLDWLVNHWAKPSITAREIYSYGPRCLRDKQTTLNLTQALVQRGWLVALETHRRDKKMWRIVRSARS
jgi:hypothetical protein